MACRLDQALSMPQLDNCRKNSDYIHAFSGWVLRLSKLRGLREGSIIDAPD
jgi:hypothetical protein